jgi:hypothetical protein
MPRGSACGKGDGRHDRIAFKLVMFDLDGTLIETAPEISDAVNDTLRDAGLPSVSLRDVQRWIGHGTFSLLVTAVASVTGRDIAQVREARRSPRHRTTVFDRHYAARCGTRSHPLSWGSRNPRCAARAGRSNGRRDQQGSALHRSDPSSNMACATISIS